MTDTEHPLAWLRNRLMVDDEANERSLYATAEGRTDIARQRSADALSAIYEIIDYIIEQETARPRIGELRFEIRAPHPPTFLNMAFVLQQYLAPGEWVDVPYAEETQEQKQ